MKLWIIGLLVFSFTILNESTVYAQDYKNEKQLIKGADEAFSKDDFKTALPLYSTLVSNYPKDPGYNYKYGACLLFGGSDKEKPIKYLQFAVSKPEVDPLAYYYYGVGLHLNYEFKKAIKYYKKFQNKGKDTDVKEFEVDNAIVQCENGTTLLKTITDLIVLDKKDLQESDFYKVYDLQEFGGQILVKPDDFQSDYEKKNSVKDIFYFPKNSEKIFFSRQNSKEGSKDIYYKIRNPDGTWSKSISMGKPVNTKFDEDFPFMHPDGNSLYFASKGHNSLGGYDIFVTRLDAQGNWTEPKNLDFAINTPADDYLFITDMEGETAYFTSNRETPHGEVSVYRINMERVPLDFAFVYGTFNSNETKKAHIKVVNAETDAVIGEYDTDENGKYKIKLPNEGKFNFIVDYENSTVAHSGLVEIQERDAFKPLKQTMEVLNQGAEDEKLVIKNLVDEEVEEDVQLTAEYLKSKAKLQVNKDKYKDRKKKKPELLEEPKTEEPVANTGSDEIANNEPVDVGKAGTSIASEKVINENVSSDGPSLVDPESSSDDSNNSGQNTENDDSETTENNRDGASNNTNNSGGDGGSSAGSGGSAGSSVLGGTAGNVAGATGATAAVLSAKKLKLGEDKGSKEEIITVTSNNKEALENDEKIYSKQAELSRNIASLSSTAAAQKRSESDKILASMGSTPSSNEESQSPEYQGAIKLKNEADALDRKAETSNKLTEQLTQNAQRSQDLQLVSETYSSKIENQNDDNTNNATYDEYEGKLDENLGKQASLVETQKEYLAAYEEKNVAAQNQQAKSGAMHQEILEIEEDIEQKESRLATAKGKEKTELEGQIATDKADLKTEKQNLIPETELTNKLNQEAALLKADLDAVDELIAQSNDDEEIGQWSDEVSHVEQVTPSAGFQADYSKTELANAEVNEASNENGTADDNSLQDTETAFNENANAAGGTSNQGSQNSNSDEEASSSQSSSQDSGTNDSGTIDSGNNSDEVAVVSSTSNSEQPEASQNINSASNSGGLSGGSSEVVQTEAGKAVGSAVSGAASSWSPDDIDTDEVFDVSSTEDLTEHELAILLDSNSENVSAFNTEETNELLTQDNQSVGAINNSGYNKKYMDQFLDLIEDEGTEYEKAVKTYVINESWLLDIEKELSYLSAIEDDVPEEYQDNLSERISNLETLQSSRFNNTESSREKTLALAQGQGTSDDLKAVTNNSRQELNVALNTDPSKASEEEELLADASSTNQESELPSGEDGAASADENSSSTATDSENENNNNSADAGNESSPESNTENNENPEDVGNDSENASGGTSEESEEFAGASNQSEENSNAEDNQSNNGGDQSSSTSSNENSTNSTNLADAGSTSAAAGSDVESNNNTDKTGDESSSPSSSETEAENNETTSGSSDSDSGTNESSSQASETETEDSSANDGNSSSEEVNSEEGQASASSNAENSSSNQGNNPSSSNSTTDNPAANSSNSSATSSAGGGDKNGKPKTVIIPGEKSDRLAKVFDAPEKSIDEVVGEKTETASADKEVIDSEVTEMETSLTENQNKLATAKRKERKTLGPQVEQQERDVADAKNQQEIAEYRISALSRAADQIIALEDGEERESEKETKRAESLKVEAEEKFTSADTREAEKARGKKKKLAKQADVYNLKSEGERKLAQSTASEQLAVEMAELEDEVIFTYKNTPETLPVSNKQLSQAEVNEIRQTPEFANYDATRKEAAEYYKQAQVAYVEAEKLENDNKAKTSEVQKLKTELGAEGDVDKINTLQTKIADLEGAIEVNEQNADAYKEDSKRLYSEYNHTNNQAVRMVKSQDPQLQENLVAYANELERRGTYAVAPIAGSSLDKDDQEGYSPDAFSRVVKGIDDYPAELTDAIFDMMDFNKSLYNSDNPIPVDTKLPGGVVYKVQIGAFRNPPPDDVFKGFAPVRGENTRPGWVRYTAGLFTSKDQARLKRNEIRALGYGDAFVVAYKDGKRISLTEAEQLIADGYKPAPSAQTAPQGTTSGTIASGEVIPVSSIKGLLYTIQVGAFRNRITSGQLYGITPLVEYQQNGLFKYGSGVYNDRQKAENDKSQVLSAGVSDAFVTAFYNGKRVSLNEASEIAKQGPGVFANATPVTFGATSATAGNIVFRVQVGAYREEVPLDDAKIILSLSNLGLDVQQNGEMTTYTVGRYASYNDAKQVQDRVIGQGLNGAFVVAYENGIRIEVQDAISKLGQ